MRVARIVLILIAALYATGCGRPANLLPQGSTANVPESDLNFYPYDQLPKTRLGGLPFNGGATLFAPVDPANLGSHHYRVLDGEKDRGILYTCKAGFLDISHVRKSGDLVPYCQVRLEAALKNRLTDIRFRSREPSIYHVTINYPAWWDQITDGQRTLVIRELSIRMAQHLAFAMVSWHEILTWYGYKSWGIISEHNSAFCYDDNPSHMLGVLAAGDALRHTSLDYDAAMTQAIDRRLQELGAVTVEQMFDAIRAVKGRWWTGSLPLRRHLDLALQDNSMTPWVVSGLSFCLNAQPFIFHLPDLTEIEGRPLGNIWRVQIEPNVVEANKIRNVIGTDEPLVDYHRDMPALLEDIRKELIDRHGPDAVSP